jgi:hypothetical protein
VADNVAITQGSGTTVATDDISSVHYQVIKLGLGADGALDTLVDSGQQAMSASVPVVIASDQSALTVASHAVTNAGVFAVQVNGDALTALQTLDNAISGSEMQVDVVGALPAGNAVIGQVKLTDGTDVADVLDLTNANPLTVAIVDGSGDQITSFGGGTQYTEGATDATITGTALLWEDSADTLVTASAAKPFPVEIVAGAGSGGTAAADDADFTAGTTSGTPAMGVYESTPTSVTDGDLGTVGITQTRALRTAVEGTVAVSNAGLTELASAIDTEVQCDIVGALPAGTNAIGKLAANSGVDIGDVDVTSLPTPIRGPGNPVVDSYTSAAVSASANTANQSLVAAPGANKQIWVYGLILTADTAAGSFSLQDSDDTACSGVMAVAANGGFAINPSGNFSMPWFKVATNKALEIDTVTCGAKGIVSYAIVDVT